MFEQSNSSHIEHLSDLSSCMEIEVLPEGIFNSNEGSYEGSYERSYEGSRDRFSAPPSIITSELVESLDIMFKKED